MFIIISKDTRIPHDIKTFDYERWSSEEFIEKGNSDDGLDIRNIDAIYYNIDSVDQTIYTALKEYTDQDIITVIYYKFSDQDITLDFSIDSGIINYEVITESTEEPDPEPFDDNEEDTSEIEIQDEKQQSPEADPYSIVTGVEVVTATETSKPGLDLQKLSSMINEPDTEEKIREGKPAKVIMFGSSKGGTGKTFTCLMSARRFAAMHPELKIALADFDIIDGQIGININKITPTMADFYKQYKAGNDTFMYFNNCALHDEHFSPNLDFYLAPPMDIPELTDDTEYWQKVFELLILNYDIVFFDSGIDYLGKEPISKLYKIADKIIITCNPSINSVKSIIKQCRTLGGIRKNSVFTKDMNILDRVYVVLTRVYEDPEINNIVVENITQYASVIAAFGNIDSMISKVQWYQEWKLIDGNKKICEYLDRITSLEDID
jgi:cellulose biosynthesis protein BcsQ